MESEFNDKHRRTKLTKAMYVAAEVVGLSRATVHRYLVAFRQGGLDGLRRCHHHRPVSAMAAYREVIRESFEKQPARTMKVFAAPPSSAGQP